MGHKLSCLLLVAVTGPGFLACSGDRTDAALAAESRSSNEAPTQAASDDPPEPGETGPAELPEDDGVIEIQGPEAQRDPHSVPIQSIRLTPATVEWREHERLADVTLEFVNVATGVVARSRSGVYTLDGDQHLVLRAGVELPEQALLGHWPDDVWYLEAQPIAPDSDGRPRFDYRLFALDRELHWVPIKYQRKAQFSGDATAVRKGWFAGVLVREGSTLTRLGSRKDPPKIGLRMGKVVLDTIEVSSGRLYNISLRPNGVYAQGTCFSQSCVDDEAKKFPLGSAWSFSTQVPRQRHSFSMLASVEIDGAVSQQLLHYETGGFKLETLVHTPTGMWPTADGGLWLLVRDELRYRRPTGEWLAIAAPAGASKLSAAMAPELGTLWLMARVGDETVVWSAANPRE